MTDWNYIRFCPYCEQDKPYPSKNSKNNRARCPDCLESYFKEKYHPLISCNYCINRYDKFKTNIVKDFFEHILLCDGVSNDK